jgi:membrane protein YqaA with SNARE-associated domain
MDLLAYLGLFFSALAAATIVPMQSEAVLVGLLMADYSPWLLVAVASIGNVLGSILNWLLGRWLERFRDRRWFPASPENLERAQRWYHRYGKWSLLLSWAPFIGDPITVIAGVLREPLRVFVPLVALAKVARYVVVAAATLRYL